MAYGWLLIGLLIIIVLVAIFKSQDLLFVYALFKKYFFVFVIIGLVLLLAFSFFKINSSNELDLTTFKGVTQLGKIYFVWLKGVFGNIGKVTGYAVNQEWFSNVTSTK